MRTIRQASDTRERGYPGWTLGNHLAGVVVTCPPATDGSDGSPNGRPEDAPDVPRHEVRTLTQGGDRAVILHDGQAYTLRITRQNKLILTK